MGLIWQDTNCWLVWIYSLFLKNHYKQMLFTKNILWSGCAGHPGRPGNLVICSNTSCCQAELRLGVWRGGWSCYLWPHSHTSQLLRVDPAPGLAPLLPEWKTPSPGHKRPAPFSTPHNKRSGQQSLHCPPLPVGTFSTLSAFWWYPPFSLSLTGNLLCAGFKKPL